MTISKRFIAIIPAVLAVFVAAFQTGCQGHSKVSQPHPCFLEKSTAEHERILAGARRLKLGQSVADVTQILGKPDKTFVAPYWKGGEGRLSLDYVLKQCHQNYVEYGTGRGDEVITVTFKDDKLIWVTSNIQEFPGIKPAAQ
jgi:hypothetical protein